MRIRGNLPIRAASVRLPLGVLTWTSWAAPESVGRAASWSSLHNPVTWRPSAAVQARALRSSAERGVRGHDEYWRAAERLEWMKYKLATILLVVGGLVVATFSAATTTPPAMAAKPTTTTSQPPAASTFYVDKCPPGGNATIPPCDGDSVILRWDEVLLSIIRAYPKETGPTIVARALGVFHTATYDAWAAYDPTAKVTQSAGPAQQTSGNPLPDKEVAISYAAYRALIDLFPPSSFGPKGGYKGAAVHLREILHYQGTEPIDGTVADPADTAATPAAVGNLAAQAVLNYRHGDGANQLADEQGTPDPSDGSGPKPYSDYTGYTPENHWDSELKGELVNWKWQPLCVPLSKASATGCTGSVQAALTPQWGKVTTFSGLGPAEFATMAPGPSQGAGGIGYSNTDVATALTDTNLGGGAAGDLKKAKAEYWADGPGSVFPPGHTAIFAQAVSRKKFFNSTDAAAEAKLDYDAKLFFMVGNAMMDASIAAWWYKYEYDFWRPITAIRHLYKTQTVTSWLGPDANKPATGNFGPVLGQNWMPYQALGVVTPGFPEYVSGHSTFTAGGATLLALFNGSDTFGASVNIPQGKSAIEPGLTPAAVGGVTLTWPTFSDASNEAGMSRRYGGIHFFSGDVHGRGVGREIAQHVYSKAQSYIKGSIGK
jgi:hypothetical protein